MRVWGSGTSFSCLFPFLSFPLFVIHSYTCRKRHRKKWHRGRSPGTALEGRVRLRGTVKEHHLFGCELRNLKRRQECGVQGTIVERVERDERKERSSEGNSETDAVRRQSSMWCVWACGVRKSKTGNKSVESAVLSTPFSSSHSWEIWSTELGGTNTNKLLSWEQVFLLLHQAAVFNQPLLKLGLKELLCKRGSLSNTGTWEKFLTWRKKGN